MRTLHLALGSPVLKRARSFAAVAVTGPCHAGKTFPLRHSYPGGNYDLPEALAVMSRSGQKRQTFLDGVRLPRMGLQPSISQIEDSGFWVGEIAVARAVGNRQSAIANDADTPTVVQSTLNESTEPGRVMGTPSYMAPEQVRGEPADHRADIFAFGCVLYEMLSGTRAFRRNTSVESMNAVLSDEPPELSASNASVPLPLERVVRRCLEKNPHNRFQSSKDLAFAIENISGLNAGPTNLGARGPHGQRGLRMAFASGALLLVVVLAFLFGRTQPPQAPRQPAALNWRGERLEGPAVAFTPRLSPDGKELAFAVMVNGLNQLAVMLVDSGDWKILTTNRSRGLIGEVCWSSNGAEIYYSHVAGGPNGIYRISRLGGEERLVVENADNPLTLTDGSLLVAKRGPDGTYGLYLFSPESEQSRPLNAFPREGPIGGLALLPDRDSAVFWGWTTKDTKTPGSLWRIDLKSGETQPFLTNVTRIFPFRHTDTFSMSHDGRRFIFSRTAETVRRLLYVDLQALQTANRSITHWRALFTPCQPLGAARRSSATGTPWQWTRMVNISW